MELENIPLSRDLVVQELASVRGVIEKWEHALTELPVPGITDPADPATVEMYFRQLCGEITLGGGKLESLSNILSQMMVFHS